VTIGALAYALLAGGGLSVEHEPLTCVRIDTYPRVEARGVPAAEVAAAELHFRAGSGGWYRIPMTRAGDAWVALLPRPTSARDRFEYQVALTSTSVDEPALSATVTVPVTPTCATASESSIAGSIVVTVPEGSPVVPPVPAGFSPVGVVAAEPPDAGSPRKPLILAGAGVVAAATVAGAVASTGQPPGSDVFIPAFMFNTTIPEPGSTVSIASGRVTVLVNMLQIPAEPVDFGFMVEFRSSASLAPCVVMSGTYNGADRIGLSLVTPLANTGFCGSPPIDTATLRLSITIGTIQAHEETVGFPFRFEP
jgi:hypothetical protein